MNFITHLNYNTTHEKATSLFNELKEKLNIKYGNYQKEEEEDTIAYSTDIGKVVLKKMFIEGGWHVTLMYFDAMNFLRQQSNEIQEL